jgi:hypothetical protein
VVSESAAIGLPDHGQVFVHGVLDLQRRIGHSIPLLVITGLVPVIPTTKAQPLF